MEVSPPKILVTEPEVVDTTTTEEPGDTPKTTVTEEPDMPEETPEEPSEAGTGSEPDFPWWPVLLIGGGLLLVLLGLSVLLKKTCEKERKAWLKAREEYLSDPNTDSAKKLEEEWKEADSSQSLEERREIDEEAKVLEEKIKAAKKLEDQALKDQKKAQEAEKRAEESGERARLAYEACMKEALAPPKPAPETKGKTDDPSGPIGGPSTTKEEEETPCCKDSDPEQERNRRNLGRVNVPVNLKVTIKGGGAHEAAVAANDISGQLADASEKLGWISKLMDIKGIGETL